MAEILFVRLEVAIGSVRGYSNHLSLSEAKNSGRIPIIETMVRVGLEFVRNVFNQVGTTRSSH